MKWGLGLRGLLLAGASSVMAAGVAHGQQPGAPADDVVETGVSNLNLGKVVVSAGQDKVSIDTPQAVTVVDQDAIDQKNASTMGDILEDIPSVNVMGGVSALGQGFSIRGLGTGVGDSDSRILFTVDGVTKFFEQYRMGSLFSEPELYKRVEVLRGPASSTLYGAGAIAGVVNFTTKDASDFLEGDDRFALRLKGGYETNAEGGFVTAIGALKPAENFEVVLFGNKRENDHYENGDGVTVIPSNALSDTYLVKGRYYFGGEKSHNVWASYQLWNSDSVQLYDQAEATFPGTVRRKVDDTTGAIGYENAFTSNNWFDLKAQLSYANSDVEQRETTFLGPYEVSEFSYATWQGRIENTSEFSFGDNWDLFVTSGLQGSKQERRNPRTASSGAVTPGALTHPEGDMKRYGAFLQGELVWDERLTIIPGVRYDKAEYQAGAGVVPQTGSDEAGFSPKLAALYNFNDVFGVFGSVAHTIRLPVVDEIYTRSATQPANLNLKPEDSENYELGFTLKFDDVLAQGDRTRFKLTAFRNDVTDLITRNNASLAGQPAYINVGESRFEGYEIEAEYGGRNVFGSLGFSAVEGTNEITGSPLNTIPADELNLTLGYVFPDLGMTFGWRGAFVDAQRRVTTPSLATPGYDVHGLFATIRVQSGPLEGADFRVSADNINDEQYETHLSSLDAEGRSLKISVGKTF